MLIGPASTREERDEFARKIEANPRGYIAQPTISLEPASRPSSTAGSTAATSTCGRSCSMAKTSSSCRAA